jgi:hypothetical protein
MHLDVNSKALQDEVRLLRRVESGAKVGQQMHVDPIPMVWRVAEVRFLHHFQAESGGRVRKDDPGVRADVTPKMLGVVEVRSLEHFRVEIGGGTRKGERGVHLQRNEGEHYQLGKTKDIEIRTILLSRNNGYAHHGLPCHQKTLVRVH